jgi:hypothetical protein
MYCTSDGFEQWGAFGSLLALPVTLIDSATPAHATQPLVSKGVETTAT